MTTRGNEWVTMAACGLIMGGSALAYSVATLIRSEDGNVVFVFALLLLLFLLFLFIFVFVFVVS